MGKEWALESMGKNQEFCFGYVNFEMPMRPLCGNVKQKVNL